jgi:pimeloyl-ACP methyl ester carboxylesterase
MSDMPTTAPIADAATAQAVLEHLDRTARHWATPCGDGTMVWRGWGSRPVVLLVHGGAGSWRHWVRNLAALSQGHTVIVPDLPGLGDSARAPDPISAESVTALVVQGLDQVVGPQAPIDVAGFSYGGVIAGLLAANAADRVRSLTVIGTGGLGPPNRSVELVRVRDKTGAERLAAHRDNLLRMMLADPANVDALALEIQEQNSKRARLNSGFIWMSRVLHDALPLVRGHVHGFWGEHEAPDRAVFDARIALLRQARPDVEIEVVPHAGHWVFYEAVERFNAALLRILAR